MHCCFMFNRLKPMDSSKSEVVPSSVADYLEKEKLCQEICKTITESVESTNHDPIVPITSLNFQSSALLPELNSDDDIEAILQQISDYLGAHFEDNSHGSDNGASDGLSVEEILKEAENIVRASTPYFERKLNSQKSSSDPLPLVKNLKHLNSVKKLIQKNYFSTNKSKEETKYTELSNYNSSIAQEYNTNENDSFINKIRSEEKTDILNSNNSFNLNNVTTNVNEENIQAIEKASLEICPELPGEGNDELEIVHSELTLQDLQTNQPGATFTLFKEDKKLCRSMSDIHNPKVDENQNRIDELEKQVAALTSKVADYEKVEANLQRSENLAAVERQRVKLLQDEIKSQEDLIDSYQNENQRLSNDIISSKFNKQFINLKKKVRTFQTELGHRIREELGQTLDIK